MYESDEEDARETFMYWWPVGARVVGVLGAFVQAGYAAVTHQSADAAFLAFCGALIAAPAIFDQQIKRNNKRIGGEKGDDARNRENR